MRLIPIILLLTMGATIYVDDDARVGGDGASWPTAYKYLQDALAVAVSGDEIRVAQGIYKADQDEVGNIAPGNREATFTLKGGVALYGGYAGINTPKPNHRNLALVNVMPRSMYETMLSGDLAGDDGPELANNVENSYHVITVIGCDQAVVIDGFTIIGGNAGDVGGGINSADSVLTIRTCTFLNNSAGKWGGGWFNFGGTVELDHCTFVGNSANWGGAMYNSNSPMMPIHCIYRDNVNLGVPWHIAEPPGDLNHDGRVNLPDLLLMAQVWGSRVGDSNFNSDADLNGDDCVNLPDLLISARYWDESM